MSIKVIDPETGREIVILTDSERKAKQNDQYANWISKVKMDPAKHRAYLDRKLAASKKFHAKRNALLADLKAKGLI